MRGRSLLLTFGFAAACVASACQRTPEPAPAPSATAVTADRPSVPEKATHASDPPQVEARSPEPRCIHETPATPPPAVTAAPRERCPKETEPAPTLATFPVTIATANGTAKVQAEVAKAPKDTERGLMYRTKMAEDQGMLFALGDRREHPFWMHNTCIPLDMMWIDDDGVIVGLLENVPTLNDEERTIGCPSTWVLEVNAGWARHHGVRAGQKLTLPPN